MVDLLKQDNPQKQENQAKTEQPGKPIIIKASTPYDQCNERLTAFGGFLAMIKFLDMIGFKEVFDSYWRGPKRQTDLGCYRMITGCLSLLFIGFQRLGQFVYIRNDAMLCGYLQVASLPVVSTFWRYLKSLGINQSRRLLNIGAVLRDRVWQAAKITYTTIHLNIDTTVTTVYGNIEAARKGHNPKHRGKKGLRPVLIFIDETKEYLCGSQRRGETISAKEAAQKIVESRLYLPNSVKRVVMRGDGEFISGETIEACEQVRYDYIFGLKNHRPPYPEQGWYRWKQYEYNEVTYQPIGWSKTARCVAMRIPEEERADRQLTAFEEDKYVYRNFVTSLSGKPHQVIEEYDGRADVENCIGEAQRAGLLAIPSKSFACNTVFFQMVMLTYNLWRWMNIMADTSNKVTSAVESTKATAPTKMTSCNISVLRLKMLFMGAKIVTHSDQTKVRYSVHDARASNIIDFMIYLDNKRKEKIRWRDDVAVTRYQKTG